MKGNERLPLADKCGGEAWRPSAVSVYGQEVFPLDVQADPAVLYNTSEGVLEYLRRHDRSEEAVS